MPKPGTLVHSVLGGGHFCQILSFLKTLLLTYFDKIRSSIAEKYAK